jgi:hypothetical protein
MYFRQALTSDIYNVGKRRALIVLGCPQCGIYSTATSGLFRKTLA